MDWLIIRFLLWLARKHPPRVIPVRDGAGPYLTRWYLARKSVDHEAMEMEKDGQAPRKFKGVAPFLHCFHRGDDDELLHNHPFKWSVSLILKGGYWEDRRIGNSVRRRKVRPWTLNFIWGTTFHRVDLYNGECWTFFLAGPRREDPEHPGQDWGFWDRETLKYTPWHDYLHGPDGKLSKTRVEA